MIVAIELQELVEAFHGMHLVEGLHLVVVALAEIVHRGEQALALARGALKAAKLQM